MTKYIFLQRLEQLLADLTEEERREALEYYQDYLDDAGISEDEDVTAKIGTPQQVAENIRAGLDQNEQQKTEIPVGEATIEDEVARRTADTDYRQYEYGNHRSNDTQHRYDNSGSDNAQYTYENNGTYDTRGETYSSKDGEGIRRRHSLFGTIIIGAVMALVIFLVAVLMVSIAVALIGTMIGMGGGTVICFGIALVYAASGSFAAVASCIGSGLVLLAFFLLLLAAVIAFCGKAFPKAMRATCNAASNMIYEQRRERV